MQSTALRNLVEIRTGYPFRERAERAAADGVGLVQMRDIDGATGWVKRELDHVQPPANWQSHRLWVGDVVLAGRGERNFAAQFANDEDAVAASHLLVLSVKGGALIPPFLAFFLNLPQTQERLRALRSGSNIPFIPIDALGQMKIPVPSIEMQNHLVNLMQLSEQEQQLMAQIQQKRRELMTAVYALLLERNETTTRE